MEKILFVNSIDMNYCADIPSVPLGILSLATILKNKNYDVEIVDFNVMKDEILLRKDISDEEKMNMMCEYILKFNPGIVDFYSMCNNYHNSIILSRYLKEKNSQVKVLFGGPHASLTAKESLEAFPWIDVIGIGEGENTIELIVNAISSGSGFSSISGIAYRENGKIIYNEQTELIEDLDKLPYLDYTLVDTEKYKKSGSIDVGRGCPFACTYCSTKTFWKRKFRLKSTERIINEIKHLKNNYNITFFELVHDLFTVDKSKVIDFCNRILEEKLDIKWGCSARLDSLDEKTIHKMKESGCSEVFLGIETGSERMQKLINKNLKLDTIESVIDNYIKNDIKPSISFIYGFPDETLEDAGKTVDLIKNLIEKKGVTIQLHLCTVLPGTEIYKNVQDTLELTGFYSDFADSLEFADSYELISKNKEIFSQFYNFQTEVRSKYLFLDRFISFFYTLIHKNLSSTCKILLNYYDDDLMKFFLQFKKIIPDFAQRLFYKNENFEMNISSQEYAYKVLLIVDEFIQKESFGNYTDLIREIHKFEMDTFRYLYIEEINEVFEEYSYDVYRIKALGYDEKIDYCYPRKIKMYKTEMGKLKIKMLA